MPRTITHPHFLSKRAKLLKGILVKFTKGMFGANPKRINLKLSLRIRAI